MVAALRAPLVSRRRNLAALQWICGRDRGHAASFDAARSCVVVVVEAVDDVVIGAMLRAFTRHGAVV